MLFGFREYHVNAGLGHVLRRNKVHLHVTESVSFRFGVLHPPLSRSCDQKSRSTSNSVKIRATVSFCLVSFFHHLNLARDCSVQEVFVALPKLTLNDLLQLHILIVASRHASRTIIELNVLDFVFRFFMFSVVFFFFFFLLLRVGWENSGNEKKYVVRYNVV